jgi:hypothetical protein
MGAHPTAPDARVPGAGRAPSDRIGCAHAALLIAITLAIRAR